MSSVLEGCHGDDLLRLGLGWVGVEAGGGGVGAGGVINTTPLPEGKGTEPERHSGKLTGKRN